MLVMNTNRLLSYVIGMQLRAKIKKGKTVGYFPKYVSKQMHIFICLQKKNRGKGEWGEGSLRTHFFEKLFGIFHFFTLPLEIPDKTKLYLWEFHKS